MGKEYLSFAGRWFEGKHGAMVTGWGQSITAKFQGSERVAIKIKGPAALGELYYSYRIDGGKWKKLLAKSGTFTLFDGLDGGVHTLTFGKNNEAQYGKWIFHDLVVDEGATAIQPDSSKFVYSAIGDSITAGYKVTCRPGDSSCAGRPDTENQNLAYTGVLADLWGITEWDSISRSGEAVSIEPNGIGEGKMIDQYKCRTFSETRCKSAEDGDVEYDFEDSTWQPDVITVNLGTNDYAFGDPSESKFQKAYEEFVAFVRSKYPNALIFCLCPLQYSFSSSSPRWVKAKAGVEGAVKELNDANILYIATGDADDLWLTPSTDYSDYTHPTVEGSVKFAKKLHEILTPVIEQHLGEKITSASLTV